MSIIRKRETLYNTLCKVNIMLILKLTRISQAGKSLEKLFNAI